MNPQTPKPISHVATIEAHQDRVILDGKYYSVDTIRKALSTPAAEPAAAGEAGPFCYFRFLKGKPDWAEDCIGKDEDEVLAYEQMTEANAYTAVPLYLHPPAAQPLPEITPEAMGFNEKECGLIAEMLAEKGMAFWAAAKSSLRLYQLAHKCTMDGGEFLLIKDGKRWPYTGPMLADDCENCGGTGNFFVGFSGCEDDGNAPLFEPCDDCAQPLPAGGVDEEAERRLFEVTSRELGLYWDSVCDKRTCHKPGEVGYEGDRFNEDGWKLWLARSRLSRGEGREAGNNHKLDTDEQVFFYEQDFYVLSNFSSFTLQWQGVRFDTSEAAYHWEKFPTAPEVQEQIHLAPSAHEAFKIAERNKGARRKDWDSVKLGIMQAILHAKADQHEYVRRKLLATGTRQLVEDSWRDDYWGWGPNKDGKNWLGRLWMMVRMELNAALASDAAQGKSA